MRVCVGEPLREVNETTEVMNLTTNNAASRFSYKMKLDSDKANIFWSSWKQIFQISCYKKDEV